PPCLPGDPVTSATGSFYDLASLTKPLVTAPLAHAFLDLDADRRFALGFHDRAEPLTVRQLLSHSSGLPPWAPFTGEPVAAQLRRGLPYGSHPLLQKAVVGDSTYSDLNYRLLAELLEAEAAVPFAQLGATSTDLSPAPWREAPAQLPDGPDAEAWRLATDAPLPAPDPHLPQDLNARAGMQGHAGFGATADQLRAWLPRWVSLWAPRMAQEEARSDVGEIWGLGLKAAHWGAGRFADLLARIPEGMGGVHVIEDPRSGEDDAPELGPLGEASGWWFHLGWTGGALFYRPGDGCCVALLMTRLGPGGRMIDDGALRRRRWATLSAFTAKLR
ncbi:MAG TPA: serine hydrolase domain-containing protein, partial [Holophagaceae bacterium]|nr:serine hydrolase domain-containing protein [Holophagaceae bacterium]